MAAKTAPFLALVRRLNDRKNTIAGPFEKTPAIYVFVRRDQPIEAALTSSSINGTYLVKLS